MPGPTVPDDQFGGPQPDNAHLSGVVLRLNDDGTAPSDNPFFAAGAGMGGEVGANIQKIFSYGHRNSFGMAVDPRSGGLWLQENGDDSFSELNLVEPGTNGGWIQIAGPVERIAQFKEIETTFGGHEPAAAALAARPTSPTHRRRRLSRLFMLPGAHYSDPEFSWKWEVAPGGIGFVDRQCPRRAVPQATCSWAPRRRTWRVATCSASTLTGQRPEDRRADARLRDDVADNLAKHEITESERLLIGRNFGVVTDIETGPNGNLTSSRSPQGTIYEIFRER